MAGGLLVTKLKLAVRGCIRLGLAANTIALHFTGVFLLHCRQSVFFGSSAISYYSPCYAGCTAHTTARDNRTRSREPR